MTLIPITICTEAFDSQLESEQLSAANANTGALVTFTGVVREGQGEQAITEMMLEHYPGMTESALTGIAQQAQERWSLGDVLIIHRYGRLLPGDVIMMVATASKHRKDAFEAAEYLMDYLKSRAPFWKQEFTADGSEWVAAKDVDEDALERW